MGRLRLRGRDEVECERGQAEEPVARVDGTALARVSDSWYAAVAGWRADLRGGCDGGVHVFAGGSDAEIVGAPGSDGGLDLLGGKVFGKGAANQGGELGVGGEAERDDVGHEEAGGGVEFGRGEQRSEAEAFFQADDAVLHLEGVGTGLEGHDDKDERHDDPPAEDVGVFGPAVDGGVEGEDEIEQKDGHEEKVEGGIEAGVVLEVLRCGHGVPF
jgi:hypothetical protein